LLRSVLDRAPIILFAVDRDGMFTLFEGRGMAVLGLQPSEVLGRSIFELYAAYPAIADNVRRVLAGESFATDLVMQRGTWWEVHYSPSRNEHDEIIGLVGVATDITRRKRAEEEADKQVRFLDSIVENIPDSVFVKDAATLEFVRLNRAGEELLGRPRTEIIGKTSHDILPREDADARTAREREVLRTGKQIDVPDDRVGGRVFHSKELPILDEHGHPQYVLGISEDITERARAEEERKRLVDRLRELDQLKARLVANVSHELRTPLTLIVALVERLLAGRTPDNPDRADLEGIARHARVLRKLVTDLLDIARLEAGEMKPDYAAVDLARLTRFVASSFDVLARERDVALSIDIPDSVPAQVDPEKVQRILANLLANALQYTPPGGRVRCALSPRGDRAAIVVEDTGPGIPTELRTRIFERFFRIEGSSPSQAGSGLGLTIVKEFTQLHGGTVHVEEAALGGARFTIELPLAAPRDATVRHPTRSVVLPTDELALARADGKAGVATEAVPKDGRSLVLLVEDNVELQRFLVEAFEDEHRVIVASDGEEGLASAVEHRPDLILTDLMMPRMTGDQLVRAVRARRELDETPIVVATAKADDALRLELLRGGAQDYILKPFSFQELRVRVRNLVALKRATDVLHAELARGKGDVVQLVEQLALRARELKTAFDAARVAGEQAERASRLKSEFLALVAHEVRTPITVLRLQLQSFERSRERGTDGSRNQLRKIVAATEQLYALVEALLERAAIESGRVRMERRRFDLASLARDVLDEMRPRAEAKALELEWRGPRDAPSMDSDPRLVRLIIANLVSNAVKFTDRGKITLAVSSSVDRLRIAITDTGPGIAEEHRTRIFEPFEQLAYLRQKHVPGLGLGLALVRDLARALGGDVDVDSAVGVGTTFTVTLPRQLATHLANTA